jgi:hypothetical protein
MLLPLFLDLHDGDWTLAWSEVRRTFKSGRWGLAVRIIDQTFGPLVPMMTENNQNVWTVWNRIVVPLRGNVVHGVAEATSEEAATILAWADQMMLQLSLRLITAAKHPLHSFFVAALEEAAGQIQSLEN